ncbi:hypothetical protein DESPIG_01522 [Desulfovibrio piger ATCC 29098]|uniref:Uncharacterized protein n=1 Tax=Desulfovibrio piger ATCC 29098 TaxID=411464 RepID=B6WTW4_9BACT|nr:hypothetical protein DESPIG_01522 [Desulfovibrio piger ATCC 29098]
MVSPPDANDVCLRSCERSGGHARSRSRLPLVSNIVRRAARPPFPAAPRLCRYGMR